MKEESKYYSVSAVNNYISYKLQTDPILKKLHVRGEVSNSRLSKGHLYFVLKDEQSEISCIIFNFNKSKFNSEVKDGVKILVVADLNHYAKKGTYHLIINELIEYGEGYLYQKFLQSKKRLEELGLFDVSHKLKVPKLCEKIGVVTSKTGEAINDIVSTVEKRFPLAQIYLYTALVQGNDAPVSISKALKRCLDDNIVDVVIIARGGGSFEDLNCFNDENLAKYIYDYPIPTVSGVGHEGDYTICDFVCDMRAPTPTAAATLVTTSKESIYEYLNDSNRKLKILFNNKLDNLQNSLNIKLNNYYLKSIDNVLNIFSDNLFRFDNRLKLCSPSNKLNENILKVQTLEKRLEVLNISKKIDDKKENIDQLFTNIYKEYVNIIERKEKQFMLNVNKLTLVNPLSIMEKGYTIVYKDDKVVYSKKDLKKDDKLSINFYDGKINVKVE